MTKIKFQLIENSNPPEDDRDVLACFKGQFKWVYFVARAMPKKFGGIQQNGYANPTHWAELNPPE